MEVDAGLWALVACIIGFITFGCFMTAPHPELQNVRPAAQRQRPDQH